MKLLKSIAIIIAVTVLLSLVSCGNTSSDGEVTTNEAITTAAPVENSVIVGYRFVEIDSETGAENNLFGMDSFKVAGKKGGVTALDVLKQVMAELGFTYTLTSNGASLHSGFNLENNADKYWTCVVDEGESQIDVSNLGNVFNVAYVSDGDVVIFKYIDRP